MTLANTIVAGNVNGTSFDIYGTVTANYCLVGDNTDPITMFASGSGTPDLEIENTSFGFAGQLWRSNTRPCRFCLAAPPSTKAATLWLLTPM